MEYPLIETAPKDGAPIWAGDQWMVYGRPWRWCAEQGRWLCWWGAKDGFVAVSGEPTRWCRSLTRFAGEVASGARGMPFATSIRRPSMIYQVTA